MMLILLAFSCVAVSSFDGASYGFNWAGTIKNHNKDTRLHPRPITFAGDENHNANEVLRWPPQRERQETSRAT